MISTIPSSIQTKTMQTEAESDADDLRKSLKALMCIRENDKNQGGWRDKSQTSTFPLQRQADIFHLSFV